jgi:serine phosphatase RsbU (regulator of sigma subunit)/anti-sigma regulatory factor (Ser/Thr protein kinase)
MVTLRGTLNRILRRSSEAPAESAPDVERPVLPPALAPEIAPDDPIVAYFQRAGGAVDIDSLTLNSPALTGLRAAGVKLVVPLVSQGELIGVLNLGSRLSEQEYSGDDRRLLDNLASHAAPAVRVAQLVRQQEVEARERESIAQELRIAHLIQQTLLPKQLPDLWGWQIGAYYQPARAVGGDFYDFIELPDGLIGIVVGDASSKGVPAALVMATTRTMLRAAAQRVVAPSLVLERTNEVLCADIPANMFVTCLYAVLNPETGHLRYANSGHCLPYLRTGEDALELRATGWPLGLMPGVTYEEKETFIEPGSSIVLYSDGLVEAHDPSGEMFGSKRVAALMREVPTEAEERMPGSSLGSQLIDHLLTDWGRFTGEEYEQEDDITLVSIERSATAGWTGAAGAPALTATGAISDNGSNAGNESGNGAMNARVLAEFDVPSEPGNERLVMDKVEVAVGDLALPSARLERLKTAVAEATMNAIEHGNKNRAELPVVVRVLATDNDLLVSITDQGGGSQSIPNPQVPDLEAKLAGLQSPRGWGLFLIKNMVDDMRVSSDESHHTVELVMHLKGDGDGPGSV